MFGGGCGIPGLSERLGVALKADAPMQATTHVLSWPNYMPTNAQRHAAFHGGALLAKAVLQQQSEAGGGGGGPGGGPVSAEKSLWLTKADYNEVGPHVIAQRCALR